MKESDNSSFDWITEEWFRRVRQNQHIHYRCADYFARLNRMLGLPTIAFSTIVGTAIFASIERDASGWLRIFIGLISISAAVLASLQTFLGYSERSEKHRITSARYAAIRRQLELVRSIPIDNEKYERELASIKQAMDSTAESAPQVPQKITKKVTQTLEEISLPQKSLVP